MQLLVKEYINCAEPISSELLKQRLDLDISPATIRNELQDLTHKGYITQPHTSAGRVPTNKGYEYFVQITFSSNIEQFPNFILREVEHARQKIDRELQMAKDLAKSLEEIYSTLNFNRIEEETLFDVLKVIGLSRTTYDKNIDLMNDLLKELENF